MTPSQHFLETARSEFQRYKTLGEKAISQIHDDAEMHWQPNEESNSLAQIIRHMVGNMLSRWTDFLTTDGEKPDRERDSEFIVTTESKTELLARWEKGWACLFKALDELTEEHLMQEVLIRRQPLTVTQAICRQLTHYSYHVGQMIYVAKCLRNDAWQTFSIPRNASAEYNAGGGKY